ncbi:uncharacterized protein LOC132299382 [Cornus florida]|uniref:uncharacterized protein LOC132299382 n=1 Tax=Cornus florida TaxID=4283 RepID=UPI0028A21323|nr:uncharacterized protein LOC132299382 [Cornus florida]
MDYMDLDEVIDVPDTPDRLAAQNTNGRGCIERENNLPAVGYSKDTDFFYEGVRNRPRDRSKHVIGNGRSRSLSLRPSKNLSISEKSKYDSNSTVSGLGNSSSFENTHLFRRISGDKAPKYEKKNSVHSQHMEKGKALFTSQTSACQEDNTVVDLTEQNRNARVFEKAFPRGALGNSQTEKIREESITINDTTSFCGMENSLKPSGNNFKGKEKVEDKRKGVSGLGRGKGIDFFGDCQPIAGMTMSTSLNSNTSPRVTGQKRLVRNGCISPHNIEKAKQSAEKHDHSSIDVPGAVASNGPPCVIDINDIIAEDNKSHRVKGKGIVVHPFSSKEPETKTTHLSSRDSIIHREKVDRQTDAGRDAFRCFEALGGWRSTRNRTKKTSLPLSDEVRHLSRREDDPGFLYQHHENKTERRENGNGNGNGNGNSNRTIGECSNDQNVSCGISQLCQSDEHRHAALTFIKRQKQGSTSSNHGDCSTSGTDDAENLFLGSSGEPSNSRSSRNQSHHGVDILNPVIEIDEFSPGIRNGGSRNIGCSSNDDSDARARQVEADEMLAHELQEQLYNEVPGVGVGVDEIDAHMALSLQQEENSQHAFPSGSRRVSRPRGSLNSNLHQQPRVQSRVRSSQNSSISRGTQSRVPTSTRMARLRGRFPGQPRTLSPRETLFPPSMDMDMRIHILEALEAFSDMGMAGGFLQVQRDFNENDYEMLLALDENNHHAGASLDQINRLPLSTVQTDNLEEACAICLDTPTNGDTMRHLPCLHKFHKDCIDPWLQRRTSCPVCKSSIT